MTTFNKWVDAEASDDLIAVAIGSLRFRLDRVCEYLPMAAGDYEQDVEHVHQTRVWCRRSASAMHVYDEFLPPRRADWLNRKLKRIRRACNDARDDDVFTARLEADKENENARHLLKIVRNHRPLSQQPITAIHKKMFADGKLPRRIEGLLKRVRVRSTNDAKSPAFGPWANARLHSVVDEFFLAAERDFSEYSNLHQFRIVGKQLRYAIEMLSGAFDSQLRGEIYPMIENLQDRLGEINDHVTAQARLNRWIEQSENKGDTRYLQSLVSDEKKRLDESTASFFEWWTKQREQDLRTAFAGLWK